MLNNPVPALRMLHTASGAAIDIAAVHDGPQNKMLNIGLLWLRASPTAIELVRRSENRTWGGWDQYIVNDELNFNIALAKLTCCHSPCIKRAFSTQGDAADKSSKGARTRRRAEGADTCSSDMPIAASPPSGSRLGHGLWSPSAYNLPQKLNHRRFGRCTHLSKTDSCRDWDIPRLSNGTAVSRFCRMTELQT